MKLLQAYRGLGFHGKIAFWGTVGTFLAILVGVTLHFIPGGGRVPPRLPNEDMWKDRHGMPVLRILVLDGATEQRVPLARIIGSGLDIRTLANGFSGNLATREGESFTVEAEGFARKEVVVTSSDIEAGEKQVRLFRTKERRNE